MNFRIWQYSRGFDICDSKNRYGFRISEIDSILIYEETNLQINMSLAKLITK